MCTSQKLNHTLEISHLMKQINESNSGEACGQKAYIFCVNKSQNDAIASHLIWCVPDFFFFSRVIFPHFETDNDKKKLKKKIS